MNEYCCPACTLPLEHMPEPHRWCCVHCHKVWDIRDVIREAYEAAQPARPDASRATPDTSSDTS